MSSWVNQSPIYYLSPTGECWTAQDADLRFDLYGSTPNKCFRDYSQACNGHSCAGGVDSNFVYSVVDLSKYEIEKLTCKKTTTNSLFVPHVNQDT